AKATGSTGSRPARPQGVTLSARAPVRNIARPAGVGADEDRATRDFLRFLNDRHARATPGASELAARVAAYELAGRMQLSAPEVADLGREPTALHRRYGTDSANPLEAAYARNCLLARPLLHPGV